MKVSVLRGDGNITCHTHGDKAVMNAEWIARLLSLEYVTIVEDDNGRVHKYFHHGLELDENGRVIEA